MRISAITKFKHGRLYETLLRLRWTQSDLSRKADLYPTCVGRIINLQARPTVKQAEKIQFALAEAGEYIDILEEWPETFSGLPRRFRIEQTEEIKVENMLDCPEVLQISEESHDEFQSCGMDEVLDEKLATCSPKEQEVIKARFWSNKTLTQVGRQFGVTRERIRQIEAKALRKLRQRMTVNEIVECRKKDLQIPGD